MFNFDICFLVKMNLGLYLMAMVLSDEVLISCVLLCYTILYLYMLYVLMFCAFLLDDSVEYNVSYVYHAMFAYFDRDNIALKGLAK